MLVISILKCLRHHITQQCCITVQTVTCSNLCTCLYTAADRTRLYQEGEGVRRCELVRDGESASLGMLLDESH